MISGISEISSATVMPASARRAIFSAAVSSLPSTIVPAWPKLMPGISSMNRPAMNATIGRRESFSVDPLGQLGLHAAAGLGVDDDALGLLVGLEQRHQLGVGGADDRVAADRDGGRLAEAGGGQRARTSRSSCRREREMTPIGPGE